MGGQFQITNKMITKLFKMMHHLLHQLPLQMEQRKEIETYQLPKQHNQLHKTSNQMQTEQSDII